MKSWRNFVFRLFHFVVRKKFRFDALCIKHEKQLKPVEFYVVFHVGIQLKSAGKTRKHIPLSLPLFLFLLLSMLFDLVFIHLLFFDLACQRADNEYNMSNIKGNFVSNSPSIPFSTFIKVQYKFWFFCSVYSYGGIRGTYQHFGPQGGQDSGFPSPRSALGYPFPAMHQNSYSGYHLGSYAPPCASPPKDGKCTSYIYITSCTLCQ